MEWLKLKIRIPPTDTWPWAALALFVWKREAVRLRRKKSLGALRLPSAVVTAYMPDAGMSHGFGLPISCSPVRCVHKALCLCTVGLQVALCSLRDPVCGREAGCSLPSAFPQQRTNATRRISLKHTWWHIWVRFSYLGNWAVLKMYELFLTLIWKRKCHFPERLTSIRTWLKLWRILIYSKRIINYGSRYF